MRIQTAHLELIPATAELLRLEASDPLALAAPLGAVIPLDWPPEEVQGVLGFFADQMDAGVTGDGWGIYYWIARDGSETLAVLVGSGGFMSKPNAGQVEIGYGTLAKFQGRGYATEAVSALTQWALSQPEVSVVVADALPENAASVRVLQKNGFTEAGPGGEKGHGGLRPYKRVNSLAEGNRKCRASRGRNTGRLILSLLSPGQVGNALPESEFTHSSGLVFISPVLSGKRR